ncbi:MAG: DsbA family protein [Halobacteriaceae archaeon]
MTRREILASIGILTLSGCLGNNSMDPPTKIPDGVVANAPIPENPNSVIYATMGSLDNPTVTYYGNWKCPYCAQFSTDFLRDIVTDYVNKNAISLRFRALVYIDGQPFLGPDAPRAARAGLAVWNLDPRTYWKFHEYIFANQPPERKRWATVDRLVSYAKQVGITATNQLRTKLKTKAYESLLQRTSQAANRAGIEGTPALVIGGETINPLGNRQRTRRLIDQLINES